MSASYPDTWYARTARPSPPRPPLDGTVETEVCVIGGGLAGLSTALGLAERGRRVALLEARRAGWGASGRNGGFVGAGFAAGMHEIIERVGLEAARRLFRLSQDAVDLVRGRIETYAIRCDPVIGPGVIKAWWSDDLEAVKAEQRFMAETFDVALELMPRERLRSQLATTRYFDGLRNPRAFHFHPLSYALGVAAAMESRGGTIFESSPAVGLKLDGPRKEVRTARGCVRADTVVIAGGGYLEGLEARLAGAIQPIATYIMVTEPLGERLKEVIAEPYAVLDSRFDFDYYRPLPDTRLLWGGGITVRRSDPPDLAARMMRRMLTVYPPLEGVRSEQVWSGLMSYARHSMPQIGRLEPGVWYGQGFGGHGMGTTALAGELLASAIAEGDDRWHLFEPWGLVWAGGAFGRAAVQLTYWRQQLRDWVRG
jgi:gamma-glutamylputrescine oxidase